MDVDDDVKQLALQGKVVRAIQLLRERTGADFDQAHTAVNALLPSAHRMRTGGVPVLLICAVILAVTVGTLFVGAAAFEQLYALFLQSGVPSLFLLLLRPEIMPLVAAAVLVFGLRLARRFRRPARFRAGVITIALALVTFWPLQLVAASVELGYREYNVFLHGLAFFISVCLFTGGIEAMRRASNTSQADSWEFLD